MKIATSKRRMTVELATSEDKAWLELDDYNCLTVLRGRVFNADGIQFEYTESRHRPDYFCFEDTATRNKKGSCNRKPLNAFQSFLPSLSAKRRRNSS